MKKYKLIKTYPGSPILGTIVKFFNKHYYEIKKGDYCGTKCDVENSPEFWEEMVENPKFVRCIFSQYPEKLTPGKIYELDENGHFIFNNNSRSHYKYNDYSNDILKFISSTEEYKLQENLGWEILHHYNYKIQKIKRFSDNKIFSIGDGVKYIDSNGNQTSGTINFIINITEKNINNSIAARISNSGNIGKLDFGINQDLPQILLENIIGLDYPLFKTDDGKNIFSGDSYYTVFTNKLCGQPLFTIFGPHKAYRKIDGIGVKLFWLKKEAQKFIDQNERIEIRGYEVKIHKVGGEGFDKSKTIYNHTSIDGNKFTKGFWEAAKIISEHDKAKIMVGCSKQFDVDLETINRILEKLND